MTKPFRREQIFEALRELGAASTEEVADHLGIDNDTVSAAIRGARCRTPGQFFRIVGYRRTVGAWQPDRAVYAAEPGPDVHKPRLDAKARKRASNKRWTDKNGAVEAAKKRVKHIKSKGIATTNIWHSLAPVSVRNVMTNVAANTRIQEAA